MKKEIESSIAANSMFVAHFSTEQKGNRTSEGRLAPGLTFVWK